jgi:retinol dehydrogenase-12
MTLFLPTLLLSPPPPTFLPSSLIDLSSKVYVFTSCTHTTLAKILYALHATIYIPPSAITSLKASCLNSKGVLHPFLINTLDLSSIKPAVTQFLSREWRLDVLFLDANDTDTSFLLAIMLLPIMQITASHFCHANPSIRIVWISSSSAPAGNSINTVDTAYLLVHEFAHRTHGGGRLDIHAHTLRNSNPSGVQHVVVDAAMPCSTLQCLFRRWVPGMRKEAKFEAYTPLYAGLAPDVRSGDWVVPWGRKGIVPERILEGIARREDGEVSVSAELYDRFREKLRSFM